MSKSVKDYPSYLDYPKPRKKQTNADRIRAMTDEELAKWLCTEIGCCNCNYLFSDKCDNGNAWLDWLKQEVEE